MHRWVFRFCGVITTLSRHGRLFQAESVDQRIASVNWTSQIDVAAARAIQKDYFRRHAGLLSLTHGAESGPTDYLGVNVRSVDATSVILRVEAGWLAGVANQIFTNGFRCPFCAEITDHLRNKPSCCSVF